MHAITYANYVMGLGKIGIIRNTPTHSFPDDGFLDVNLNQ